MNAQSVGKTSWLFTFAAWIVALLATLSVLFIGEVMGQEPCNLCWYQRVFMFPLAVILAVGSFQSDDNVWKYGVPLAAAGWLIAAFHVLLYLGIIPEAIEPCGLGPSCSSADMTVFGWLPLPVLSAAAFTTIIILLLLGKRSDPT